MSTTFAPGRERRLPAVHPGPRPEPARRSRGTRSTTPTPTTSTATTWRWSARPSSRSSTWSRRTSSATTRRSSSRSPASASRFKKLDKRVLHNAVRLLTGSAADFLDDYFESDLLKGYLASSSIIGTKVGPRSQGSGLVLLYHSIGEHDGEFGSWAFHKKGNGGFTQVLARAAQSFGAEIVLESPVDSVITKDGRATGVALEDGTRVLRRHRRQRARPAAHVPRARQPARAARRPRREHPALPLPGDELQGQLRARRAAEVPGARPEARDQFRGFTNIGPSMDYLERAFDDAKYGWYSQHPYIDMAIQSTIDAGHGAPRQARPELLHPVHAVQAARERLGHREGEPRRHRPADARAVLPGLRRPRAPARGPDAARHRADRRPVRGQHLRRRVLRARRCSSSDPRRAGRSTARRSTATTSAARARIPAAASRRRRASSPRARSSRTGRRPGPGPDDGAIRRGTCEHPPDCERRAGVRSSRVIRVATLR